MKKFIKWTLISIAAFAFLVIGALGIVFYTGKRSTEDVRKICEIKVGTAIEEVIPMARRLGFSEAEQGPLGGGIVVFADSRSDGIRWPIYNDSLPGIDHGRLKFGKMSLPPFLRNYCEVSFRDRKVTGTRTWTLD